LLDTPEIFPRTPNDQSNGIAVDGDDLGVGITIAASWR